VAASTGSKQTKSPRIAAKGAKASGSEYCILHEGYFVSPPIIETLASYYEFRGISEKLPVSDPADKVDRPVGVLALAAAAVERVYTMYLDGSYVESKRQFNKTLWGPTTAHYVTRAKDMSNGRWAEVFHCLKNVLARKQQADHTDHGGPPPSDIRPPVPDSDDDENFLESNNEVDGDEA